MRRFSVATMLVEVVLALSRGKRRLALLLLGAAVLSTRSSMVGFLAEILVRLYQWRR